MASLAILLPEPNGAATPIDRIVDRLRTHDVRCEVPPLTYSDATIDIGTLASAVAELAADGTSDDSPVVVFCPGVSGLLMTALPREVRYHAIYAGAAFTPASAVATHRDRWAVAAALCRAGQFSLDIEYLRDITDCDPPEITMSDYVVLRNEPALPESLQVILSASCHTQSQWSFAPPVYETNAGGIITLVSARARLGFSGVSSRGTAGRFEDIGQSESSRPPLSRTPTSERALDGTDDALDNHGRFLATPDG